jgi:hypothetical protein
MDPCNGEQWAVTAKLTPATAIFIRRSQTQKHRILSSWGSRAGRESHSDGKQSTVLRGWRSSVDPGNSRPLARVGGGDRGMHTQNRAPMITHLTVCKVCLNFVLWRKRRNGRHSDHLTLPNKILKERPRNSSLNKGKGFVRQSRLSGGALLSPGLPQLLWPLPGLNTSHWVSFQSSKTQFLCVCGGGGGMGGFG